MLLQYELLTCDEPLLVRWHGKDVFELHDESDHWVDYHLIQLDAASQKQAVARCCAKCTPIEKRSEAGQFSAAEKPYS